MSIKGKTVYVVYWTDVHGNGGILKVFEYEKEANKYADREHCFVSEEVIE